MQITKKLLKIKNKKPIEALSSLEIMNEKIGMGENHC